jgi:hypothetical protein
MGGPLMRLRLGSAPSLLAMAAMMTAAPMAARAQSFNATGTIVAGLGDISVAPGTTTVATDSPNVVINWSPSDTASGGGPIDFQSAGTSALFSNRDATSLTVLNRILPKDLTRPITFNGTVTSQLVDLATGAASRGGTVFFYSPGGVLVSATGVFNVGNLVLTTSDLNFDAAIGVFGNAGTYKFLPANAGSRVEIQKGARITAGPNNAYVALIAPQVINSGLINVDGSAVIVAADASTITFRPNGLFDIQIDQGTSTTGEVVTNDGVITGPVANANAVHRVYMVAVPKNDAITLAIKGGSALGFDVAGAANVDGNAIVLSAGYNIANGLIDTVRAKASAAVPAALEIGAITATSQVTGKATGQASLVVDSGNAASFASNLSLSGVQDPAAASNDGAFISVGGIGSTLDVTGNLELTALDGGQVTGSFSTDSGNAVITVDQGSLTVGGAASISSARAPLVEVDTTAGSAALTARSGAVVNIGSDLSINASGIGKSTDAASNLGPNQAKGGTAQLSLESGSNVTVGRDLVLDATGTGGGAFLNDFAGANGSGGQAIIEGKANGGVLDVTGVTTLDARGIGGIGQRCIACTVEGGTGSGGTASILAAAGTNFRFGDVVTVDATGQGGAAAATFGKDGGAGVGGSAAVRSTGGAVTFVRSLDVLADGRGGAGATVNSALSGATGSGGTGGSGTGGTASLAAGDALTLGTGGSIAITGATAISAAGTGGDGGNGGAGNGGTAAVTARNGTANGTGLSVRANGTGGAGGNGGIGGAGTGGSADVIGYAALEGGASLSFGDALIDARGRGGAGGAPTLFPDDGGAGGSGTGGQARALAQAGNADLALVGTTVTANGIGGSGGTGGSSISGGPGGTGGSGGNGRGGSATLGVIAGAAAVAPTGSASFAASGVSANGIGGAGGAGGIGQSASIDGNGGNAVGGTATITAEAGVLNLSGSIQGQADATGGNSGFSTGGNAQVGGTADAGDLRGVRLLIGTGRISGQTMTFSANATGGTGATAGTASILGHPLTWLLGGGSINASSLSFTSAGTAAAGAPASTIALAGGNSVLTGGLTFNTPADLTATLDGADVSTGSATISAGNWLPGAAPAGTAGTLSGTTSVSLTTGGDLFAHMSARSGGALTVSAPGLVRLDDLTSLGAVGVAAGTSVSLGAIRSGGDATVDAPGNISVGTVSAVGAALLTSGAALTTGTVTAGQRVSLRGATSVAAGGAIQAGDSVQLVSDGTVSAASVSAGLVSPSALSGATYGITVRGLEGVTLGNVAAARDIVLLSPRAITTGSLAGREIVALGGGAQSLGAITAPGRVLLADYEMFGIGGNPLSNYNLDAVLTAQPLPAGASITVTGAINAGALTAVSFGDVSVRNVTTQRALPASGAIALQAGGALAAGALVADNRIDLTSAATMDVTSANAGDSLSLDSLGALTAGSLGGGAGVTVKGGAAVIVAGSVGATGGSISVNAVGNLTGRAMSSTGTITLGSSVGSIAVGNLASSNGAVVLTAKVAGTAGAVAARSGVAMSAGADLALTSATSATGDVTLTAGAALSSGAVTATAGRVVAASGGLAVLGNLDAGSTVLINAAGDLRIGNVSAKGTTVELRTNGGSLTAGTITAATDTALLALGDLAVGTVQARDILLLASGNIRTADLTTQTGRILAASNSLGLAGGTIGAFNFDSVFAAPLASAGGGLTVTGPVTANTFTAAVAGDATTQGIAAARSILVDAGGTVRLGGVWQSPSIELRAGDLDMPAGSGLNAGISGTITLVSRNAAGMRIGDGLDGSVVPTSGFTIDNAEWSRINSGSLSVFAPDIAGPVDILIGKLDVTGPDAGSTIDDPLGSVQFRTGGTVAGAPSGTIRVAGALRAAGFRASNALVFRTGQFQLASDTGSLTVLGKGDTATGTLQIEARDIHVAATPLLAQLAADPFFAGVEPALDSVSAGSSGPVLRAGALDFTVGRSFYIQRTGSGFDPLGFEEPLDGFKVTSAGASPIAVIINGTFRTATGLIGGPQAWLQFKQSGFNFSGFSADSRLNGCLLTAATCGLDSRGLPDPGIRTVIEGVGTPAIGDTPPDPEEPQPKVQSAILPPPLLLPIQPDALPGQVDEAIAGSGNPALIGGSVPEGARP